jgi:hypothetical protein
MRSEVRPAIPVHSNDMLANLTTLAQACRKNEISRTDAT